MIHAVKGSVLTTMCGLEQWVEGKKMLKVSHGFRHVTCKPCLVILRESHLRALKVIEDELNNKSDYYKDLCNSNTEEV